MLFTATEEKTLIATKVSGYFNIFLQVLYYLFMYPHFLKRKEGIDPSDKLDNESGLVGHGVLPLCSHLPTVKEITVHHV